MRILIAYDGSELARESLAELAMAGLPKDAEALVLSVLDGWLPAEESRDGQAEQVLPGLPKIRAETRAAVERQRKTAEEGAARLRAQFPGWKVTSDALADSPAWAIIKRAEGHDGGVGGKPADLVVVGSHGYGGFKRLVLGSVSHKVVTEVQCAVRIVRSRGKTRDPLVSPPRIVIGVDGSEDSLAAVDAVAGRTWPQGTRVLIATFEQPIFIDAGIGGPHSVWGGSPAEYSSMVGAESVGEQIVTAAAERLRKRCPAVEISTVVKLGDPKYSLLDAAENWADGSVKGADCIVVGAAGVRGIERFLLGSVSTAVAMGAHCSVEIVHASAGKQS